MSEKNCQGCQDSRLNTTEGCCDFAMDSSDGEPSRCVGEWTEDKHHYLRRYADIFSKGMKNKWTNLVYIDLFAGPGRCRIRPRGSFCDGSPLIGLQLGFTHYYFVDLSKSCTDTLNERAKPFREFKNVAVLNGDANEKVVEVVDAVKKLGPSTLVFAFVDPTGIEIHWESMKLLSSIANDVIILVPRGMNLNRQMRHQAVKPKDVETSFDRYFNTAAWRGKNGVQMLNLYTQRLGELGYSFVGDSQGVKYWQKNVSLYDLIFASKNSKGAEFWEKITSIQPSGQRTLFQLG